MFSGRVKVIFLLAIVTTLLECLLGPHDAAEQIPARKLAVYRVYIGSTMLLRGAFVLLALAAQGNAQVQFNRDIRPIMAETCFRCHGPDRSSRMAGFRLDIREEALKPTASGATPIVPGDAEKSAIVQRVFSTGARIMPPAFAHKDLTQAQKETIRRWVAAGAKYEGHWAYQPVRRPTVAAAGNP